MDDDFTPPPEAPVFEPTPEEFHDPVAYISSIRPRAEKFGICKIKPPTHWQPPFAVNVDTFKFLPRIQRLNELEAKSRIRQYFLNDLAKFWELQNNLLRKQVVENKILDYYHLRKFVLERDGYHRVTKNGKWKEVSSLLGYSGSYEVANQLQKIYEKTLLPYDVVVSGVSGNRDQQQQHVPTKIEDVVEEKKPIQPEIQEDCQKAINSEFLSSVQNQVVINAELKKLQFYGPGPRMSLPDFNEFEFAASKRTRPKNKGGRSLDVSGKTCAVCGGNDSELGMLISCSTCPAVYHHVCSVIGPKEGSRKPWRCHNCIAKECKKPMPSYGFEESKTEYTLSSFGKMADEFKSNHFKALCHEVSCSEVEKRFWHLVNSLESDVVVEYGADIHTLTAGSGFPTDRSRHLISEEEQEYISSPWNLNNLPVLPKSLLRHIDAEINGMKVPWVYVGMCFSSFAWHIEDHWNYSINYLHWGEPKTWYGVPGCSAELLEECMRKNAPELFEEFPDLLHHITTIMNPNVLMNSGVPIFRTDQQAGEFVITFPRAYHSGFNQGYNCAEAVNFCTADWLPFGHGCIENYRLLKRQCVFSNDEFMCKMMLGFGNLSQECIYSLFQVFQLIMKRERELHDRVTKKNITNWVRKDFENVQDDERQCCFCNTTCYLSAIQCSCSDSKMVCLHHIDELCECPSSEKTFLYRSTLHELEEMGANLASQLNDLAVWSEKVQKSLAAKGRHRLKFETLKKLLTVAVEDNYPCCPAFNSLKAVCKKGDRYFQVMSILDVRAGNAKDLGKRPSFEELLKMLDDVDDLPFRVPFKPDLIGYVTDIQDYCDEIKAEVSKYPLNSDAIDLLFEKASKFNIDIPSLSLLHQAVSKISWLEEVCAVENEEMKLSCGTVQRLLETGQKFPACADSTEKLILLRQLIEDFRRLELKATSYLIEKPSKSLEDLESLLVECQSSKVAIPSTHNLESSIKDFKETNLAINAMFKDQIELDGDNKMRPYLEDVNNQLSKMEQIPINFPRASYFSGKVFFANSWIRDVSKKVLKLPKDSVIDVFLPRNDISFLSGCSDTMGRVIDLDRNLKDFNFHEERERELNDMRVLRAVNESKFASSKKCTFCVCQQMKSGLMIQCHLCRDLFHMSCVDYRKDDAAKMDAEYEGYLCPRCARTKRPSLSHLSNFVSRYDNDIDIRLHEADVLKDTVQRATIWEENVQKIFKSLNIPSMATIWKQGDDQKKVVPLREFSLSESSFGTLEELLMAGNLMEVSLSQKNLIRHILCNSRNDYENMIFDFPNVLPDLVEMCNKSKAVSVKRKRMLDTSLRAANSNSAPAKKSKKLNKTFPSASRGSSKSANNSYNGEKCSAQHCQDPEGDLQWVQCDFCEKWFHFKCIGLQKIKKQEKFQCEFCAATTMSSSSPINTVTAKLTSGTKKLTKKDASEQTLNPLKKASMSLKSIIPTTTFIVSLKGGGRTAKNFRLVTVKTKSPATSALQSGQESLKECNPLDPSIPTDETDEPLEIIDLESDNPGHEQVPVPCNRATSTAGENSLISPTVSAVLICQPKPMSPDGLCAPKESSSPCDVIIIDDDD